MLIINLLSAVILLSDKVTSIGHPRAPDSHNGINSYIASVFDKTKYDRGTTNSLKNDYHLKQKHPIDSPRRQGDANKDLHCKISTMPCKGHEFQCKSGDCIKYSEVCDGIPHCEDCSDENNSNCSSMGHPGWCPLPPTTSDKTYSLLNCEANSTDPVCQKSSGDLVHPGSLLRFQCKNADNERFTSICMNGEWTPSIGTCTTAECGTMNKHVEYYNTHIPWQVKIFEKGSLIPSCGGVIVSRYAVISAAHCFVNLSDMFPRPRLAEEFFVAAGEGERAHLYEISVIYFSPEPETFFRIDDPHEQYFTNIVVLEVKPKIVYMTDVSSICLWSYSDPTNLNGRGMISSYTSVNAEPRYPGDGFMTTDELNTVDCDQFESSGWSYKVTGDKICSQDEFYVEPRTNGGIGFYTRRNVSSQHPQYKLRGIFSSAFYDVNAGRRATFFTDIKYYSSWIYKLLDSIRRKQERRGRPNKA